MRIRFRRRNTENTLVAQTDPAQLELAQAEAAAIRVDNETARVETVVRNGVPMYRVILGPYTTCAEAQRVARVAAKPGVWIPEGGCDVPPPANEPLAR